MPILGRRVAVKDQVLKLGGTGEPTLAATVFGPVSENSWVTGFGGWVGTQGTPASEEITLGAFTINAAGEPDVWIGQVTIALTTQLDGSTAGEAVEERQTSTNLGLQNQGIPLVAGESVAVFCFSTDEIAVSYGLDPALTTYLLDDPTEVPVVFGDADDTMAGQALDLWVNLASNTTPPVVNATWLRDVQSNGSHRLTPFANPSGYYAVWGGEVAVNFSRFDLTDEVHGDEISAVQLQIATDPSDGANLWEGTISKGEFYPILSVNAAMSGSAYDLMASYRGPKLPPGWYFARARFADHFGAYSEWTPFLERGGSDAWAVWVDRRNHYLEVTAGWAPVAKITDVSPATFTTMLLATSTLTATHAHLQIAETVGDTIAEPVLSQVVALSPAVNPGDIISVAWDAGWDDLLPGAAYAYRIRAIHQGTDYSYPSNAPEWQEFRIDALPAVPSSLAPNGAAVAALPLLTATAADADDMAASGFGVRFEVTQPDAGVVTVVAALVDGTTDQWAFQTTAVELDAFGAYSWRAQSYTPDATSEWSSAASFTYAASPAVTITAPLDLATVMGSSFDVEWTSDETQASKRVMLRDTDGVVAYDSGTVVSATLAHAVPTDDLLHEAEYEIFVTSTSVTGIAATAETVVVTMEFTPPAAVTLTATPVALAGDVEPTAIQLDWPESAEPEPTFALYRITREPLATGDDPPGETVIGEIDARGTTVFVDRFPASGMLYRYRVYVVAQRGAGEVASVAGSDEQSIELTALMVVAAGFGVEARARLRYADSSDIEHLDDTESIIPWGEEKPLVYIGEARYRTFVGTFSLINDASGQAVTGLNALRTINRSRTLVCYRDNRGRKIFGKMRLTESDRRIKWYVVTLTLTETSFHELGVNP